MITADTLLRAYAKGYFPMADSRHDEAVYWFHPERRGILPLDAFHVPASLRKFMRRSQANITFDQAFETVIRQCADTRSGGETWINDAIIGLYCELFARGAAHSVECWEEGKLMGGLYGVSLGGAFFGESMFSLAPNASKMALAALVERLKAAGYVLLDAQYVNEHLKQFGAREISRLDYLQVLRNALKVSPNPSARFSTLSDIRS